MRLFADPREMSSRTRAASAATDGRGTEGAGWTRPPPRVAYGSTKTQRP